MKFVTLIAILLLALDCASAALAVPLYNIVPLGFDDLEHTHSNGYKSSSAYQLNEAGQVSGYSERYNGGGTFLGESVWLYDGATTIDIGLTGPEYTANNGYKYSYTNQLNEAGQVIGNSSRYSGSTGLGQTAWLYDGATTIDIGLTGNEHTRSDGYKSSDTLDLNEAGQVSGSSERYNGGGLQLGQTSWFYDGATTIDIGLTGSEHTRNDGYKSSYASQLNEAGQVRGSSERYNGGGDYLGQSAWLYNGANTIIIGLVSNEYTRSDGYKSTLAGQVNEAGQVSGWSARFNGGFDYFGSSAWLYNGATTIEIGLTGPEHTRNDGYKYSYSYLLNEAGQVSGNSQRYNGTGTDLGQSAWFYHGATTIEIGLTGTEHTRSDGYKLSFAAGLNESGQVIGNSLRYSGSTELGVSSWIYDGATTIDIGLTGAEFTRNDGYRHNSVTIPTNTIFGMNDAGQVLGKARRFNGGATELGEVAWLYDSTLHQTFPLVLSMRSDGYASSDAYYLGEDGLVLGSYTLFDAQGNEVGKRPFYFTSAGGLHDLGSLVKGGLPASGWDFLANAVRANGFRQILGHGKLTSQSAGQMAYLLTPAIPEPGAVLLAILATLIAPFVISRQRLCLGQRGCIHAHIPLLLEDK